MEDVIRLLPDSIANQIAAGEVVQRPASAVKEILENSIDAGASSIKLIVKDAGKSLIQVIDNGKGMSPTDARMSFERHATSKLRNAEDLFKIKSMGFRGEALASIAAVAQVDLKTRPENEELGTNLQIEASEVKLQEPVASAAGTSLCVRNLFYNIPARRNFLKSNPVELRHITDEFIRVALAHPEIQFSFHQNDQEMYVLDSGKLSKRIVQLFGKNYQKQLVPCQEETPDIKVSGYIGKPEQAKKTRGEQFFFINGRFIKNPYLNHAVSNAFEGMLKEDCFPFYVLFIDMDPAHVDVNVHPTKTEVKFDDDRLLYGVISAAVRQALATANVTPSLDFGTDVNFLQFAPQRSDVPTSKADRAYGSFQTIKTERPSAKNWEMLYKSADREEQLSREQAKKELDVQPQTITLSSKLNQPQPPSEAPINEQGGQTLYIHGQYLVRQVKSGMVLVDQQAAHERILFERYLDRKKSQQGLSQSCLFPTQIELSTPDMTLVEEMKTEIQQLGFEFESFGPTSIVINGVPPEIVNTSEKEIFEGLIEQFKMNQDQLNLSRDENLARALAKRTSVKMGQILKDEEVTQMFDQLFACGQPNFTPDGKPTFVVLSLDKIASLFN